MDPAIRARGTKLKKLGLISQADDIKTNKKCQLLQAYTGSACDAAEDVVHDLLGIPAQTA
jgi:hypothetical protein